MLSQITYIIALLCFAAAFPQAPTTTTVSGTATATTTLYIAAAQPPPYDPLVTAPPDQDAVLAEKGYYLTTYYACNTWGGEEHCGWHVPLRKLEDSAGRREGVPWGMVVVGIVVGLGVWR